MKEYQLNADEQATCIAYVQTAQSILTDRMMMILSANTALEPDDFFGLYDDTDKQLFLDLDSFRSLLDETDLLTEKQLPLLLWCIFTCTKFIPESRMSLVDILPVIEALSS